MAFYLNLLPRFNSLQLLWFTLISWLIIQFLIGILERYPSGSLARRPVPGDLREGDEDDYTEQLRQIQRSITSAEPGPQVRYNYSKSIFPLLEFS